MVTTCGLHARYDLGGEARRIRPILSLHLISCGKGFDLPHEGVDAPL